MSRPLRHSLPVLGLTVVAILIAAMLLRLLEAPLPPPISPLPEDPIELRKANLINHLLSAIQNNNRSLLKQRKRAVRILANISNAKKPSHFDLKWLAKMGKRYRLPEQDPDEAWMHLLLRRLDIIPADLALAQAAMESAWGESRFANEGNNFFGEWCFKEGCGIVPAARPAGATYEVATFESVEDSVRGYMLNLNRHPRYTQLRIIRESARQAGQDITGEALAKGLHGYSAIGDTYIRTIRALIRANDFDRFPSR